MLKKSSKSHLIQQIIPYPQHYQISNETEPIEVNKVQKNNWPSKAHHNGTQNRVNAYKDALIRLGEQYLCHLVSFMH